MPEDPSEIPPPQPESETAVPVQQSAPAPPEPEKPAPLERPKPGRRLLWCAVILVTMVTGFAAGTWLARREEGLSVELAQTKERLRALEKQDAQLKEKGETLEKQNSQLTEISRTLKEDKDKLAIEAQADQNNMKSQISSLTDERRRLNVVARRLIRDNQTLNTKTKLIEQQNSVMQQSNERLILQRDTIQRQLAKAEKHSKQQELQRQLIEKQKETNELKKASSSAQKKIRKIESTEKKTLADLTKAQTRLKQLQQGYAGLVSENSQFKEQVNKAPEDVTRLARQHERLTREAATMHYNLGVILSKQKDYGKAAAEFKKVVELRPDDADAYYNLGVIYAEHLPNRDKALSFFRQYLKLSPHSQDAGWVKQYIATWQAWEAKERLD